MIEAHINTFDLNSICFSETFLYSSVSIDDQGINFKGYSLLREDHPTDTKRRDACTYYKEFVPLIERKDITSLKECITTGTMFNNEKCFFIHGCTDYQVKIMSSLIHFALVLTIF